MNKYIFLCLFTLCHFLEGHFSLEVRSGGFFHAPDRFQMVYGKWGSFVGGEAAMQISNHCGVWLDIDYFKESNHGCCASSLKVVNGSFGLRGNYCVCRYLDFYLGIGPSFSRMQLKNQTICCHETILHTSCGGVIKSGFYLALPKCYFLDIFADYLYQPVCKGRSFNLGGVKLGVGIGRHF